MPAPNKPEDFWKRVEKKLDNECWNWIAGKDSHGYGLWNLSGKRYFAHRFSMILNGLNLELYDVLHKCDNPSCVNPNHLFLGTHTDNMRDMVAKGRHVSPTKGRARTDEEKQKISESVSRTLLTKKEDLRC